MSLKLYYKIWVDGLTKLRSIPSNKGMWKFYSTTFISFAMAMNLALFMAILERNVLKHSFDLDINFFTSKKLNSFLSFFVLYLLLPLLINYFLIFRNKRYEILISKYKSYDGKLFLTYILISFFLPFILILIAVLLGFG